MRRRKPDKNIEVIRNVNAKMRSILVIYARYSDVAIVYEGSSITAVMNNHEDLFLV